MSISSITDKAAYAISQMLGGAKKVATPVAPRTVHFPTFFLLTLFILLLRALIVFWGYNALVPKFIVTLGPDPANLRHFRELNFGEAVLLVIAVQCLVN
jgi:hypothetical protein